MLAPDGASASPRSPGGGWGGGEPNRPSRARPALRPRTPRRLAVSAPPSSRSRARAAPARSPPRRPPPPPPAAPHAHPPALARRSSSPPPSRSKLGDLHLRHRRARNAHPGTLHRVLRTRVLTAPAACTDPV